MLDNNQEPNIASLILQEILQSHPFLTSQKFKTQVYQWKGVKRIKSYFRELRKLWEKVWGSFLLPQVVLISSIKPNLSNISRRLFASNYRDLNIFLDFCKCFVKLSIIY